MANSMAAKYTQQLLTESQGNLRVAFVVRDCTVTRLFN